MFVQLIHTKQWSGAIYFICTILYIKINNNAEKEYKWIQPNNSTMRQRRRRGGGVPLYSGVALASWQCLSICLMRTTHSTRRAATHTLNTFYILHTTARAADWCMKNFLWMWCSTRTVREIRHHHQFSIEGNVRESNGRMNSSSSTYTHHCIVIIFNGFRALNVYSYMYCIQFFWMIYGFGGGGGVRRRWQRDDESENYISHHSHTHSHIHWLYFFFFKWTNITLLLTLWHE